MRLLSPISLPGLFVSLSLVSCGGGTAATSDTTPNGPATAGGDAHTTPAAAAGDPADLPAMPEGIAGPPTNWDDMAPEAKGQWMAEHVVPTMGPLFAAYDSTRYADITCATCHGPNARDVHFAMPSPALPVLPQFGTAAWDELAAREPRAIAFMATRVEHAMAAVIGEHPYDPATQQGFACTNCHTMQATVAAAPPGRP